ncbi:biotin synthase [Arthrobacter sp. AG258]|uniref:biotin synthase BioB n=1 Tax=Arthrobacter sp. AG258 TaxID=2183899 RepID=UPI0010EBF43C|nr:biotin synthase BioB [Arthrobacter sp. AG258]TDT76169.1 biotin synthase [Arthrobacter sp. AG258]
MTNSPPLQDHSILETARRQVLEQGAGLAREQLLEVFRLPDEALPELLELAHHVRLRHCGEDLEVEGIISIKTGGCPEDCHFCSQSGLFDSPVRGVWLDIPELVKAAKETAATGATEFCIVAAVRGPDIKLMNQVKFAIDRIRQEVDINIACSLGMLTRRQVEQLAGWGVHRYNHNLETARSFFPQVVTTHTYEERLETCAMIKDAGMELCCGALIGMGETLEQRAELAAQLAALGPHEVPLNFLNPRPGTPLQDQPLMDGKDALRAIAAFRLAMPGTVLRYAGGRELTLGFLCSPVPCTGTRPRRRTRPSRRRTTAATHRRRTTTTGARTFSSWSRRASARRAAAGSGSRFPRWAGGPVAPGTDCMLRKGDSGLWCVSSRTRTMAA